MRRFSWVLVVATLLAVGCSSRQMFVEHAAGHRPHYVALHCSAAGKPAGDDASYSMAVDFARGKGDASYYIHPSKPDAFDRCEVVQVDGEVACSYEVKPVCENGESCHVTLSACP